MKARLLDAQDELWRAALTRLPHDVYHLPSYTAFEAAREGGRGVALYAASAGGELLVPLVTRPTPAFIALPADAVDASSPYGYGSPTHTEGASHADVVSLLDACVTCAAQNNVVSLFLRLHPLLPAIHDVFEGRGAVVHHGDTVFVDLRQTAEAYSAALPQNYRYEIRRLARLGFEIEFDNWSRLEAFAELYRGTMQRVEAQGAYLFPNEYFTGLRTALGDALHLCCCIAPDGTVAAASLFTERHGLMQYHLSGSADAFLKLSPTKLVLNEIVAWGRRAGAGMLHLGGGVGGAADSLFRFKSGFSPLRAEFRSVRLVTLPAAYEALTTAWSATAGRPSPGLDGFFPAYRAPT